MHAVGGRIDDLYDLADALHSNRLADIRVAARGAMSTHLLAGGAAVGCGHGEITPGYR
jgi:hypothetical protein